MEYLLKLRVKRSKLAEEIRYALKTEYGIDSEELEEVGHVTLQDGQEKLVLLQQVNGGAELIARGYDGNDEWSPKYRVHGSVRVECPKCQYEKAFEDGEKFCKRCGTRLELSLR